MSDQQALWAEAYRRNILPPERRALYEEAMRRGLVQGPERSMVQRFMDNVGDSMANSVFGAARRAVDRDDDGIDWQDLVGRGWTDVSQLGPVITEGSGVDRFLDRRLGENRRILPGVAERSYDRDERERRALYEARSEADPIRNPGDFVAFLAGQVVGGITSPENVLAPGRNFVTRALAAGGIGAAADAGIQGNNVASGVQDRYSGMQTAGAALLSSGFSLAADAVRPTARFVRDAFTRRIEPPAPPPGMATEGIEVGLPDGTVVDVPRTPDAAATPEPAAPVQMPDFASVEPVARDTFLTRQQRRLGERGLPGYVHDLTARGYTAVIDEMHPIVQMRERFMQAEEAVTGAPARPLRPSQDPLKLSRGLRDVPNVGHMDILHGVHAYGSIDAPTGPALADIMTAASARDIRLGKAAEDGLGALGKYAAAKRAIAEWDNFTAGRLENRPTVEERADLEAFVARMDQERPELAELADNLNAYAQGLLRKKLDAGLIDKATFDGAMGARSFYVPLKRVAKDSGAVGGAGGTNQGAAVKAYFGMTDEQITEGNTRFLDPVQVLIEETYRTAQRVRQNDLNRSIIGMARRLDGVMQSAGMQGDNGLIRKVPRPVLKQNVGDGVSGDLFDDLPDIFRTGEVNAAGRPILFVWENGKKEAYELLDPEWGEMVFEAVSAMTKAQSDVVVNAIGAFSTAVTRTVTREPAFLFANFLRDGLSAWMLNPGVRPFEGLVGVGEELRQADSSRLYNLGGGISGGEASAGIEGALRQRTGAEVTRRFRWNVDSIRRRYASDWRSGGRALMDVYRMTELTETGTRRTIFNKVFARAKKEGMTDEDALREAAFSSRDYQDFGRHGSALWAARRVVPFLNAATQGLDKTFRAAIADPASAVGRAYKFGGTEEAMRAILRPLLRQDLSGLKVRKADQAALKLAVHYWTRAAILGGFGLTLSAINRDDPDYQQAPDDMRATHWIVPMGGGVNMRIPKPFEHAALSNLFERAYEASYGGDETAWGRMWDGMLHLFAPPMGAPLLDAITGAVTEVDPTTGRDIIPAGTENLDPEMQFNVWTSQASKGLADGLRSVGFDVAPAKIDYLIRTLGGPVGTYFAGMSDITDPDRPAGSWTEAPVVRRFFGQAYKGSQDKRDFYERAGAQSAALNRALNSIRRAEADGDESLARQIYAELDEPGRIYVMSQRGEASTDRLNPLMRARAVGTNASRLIGELNGVAPRGDNARALPEMTARQRQAAIEALERLVVAEMGNAMIATRQPGFTTKNLRDRAAIWDELETVAPEVADELNHRLTRGDERAYDYDAVMRAWPQVEARLREQGTTARLDDLARRAQRDTPGWGRRNRRVETDMLDLTL